LSSDLAWAGGEQQTDCRIATPGGREPPDVLREDTHKLDPALGSGLQSMSVLGPMLRRFILLQL